MWPQVAALATHISIPLTVTWIIGIGKASGHRQLHGPLTSTRPLVAAQPTDINMATGHIRATIHSWSSAWTTGLNMASDGLHRPLTPTSLSPQAAKPKDITKVSVSSTDCTCPYVSQASSRPGAAAWATDTSMASSDITDHSGPSRRPNPKNELFFILGLHHRPDPGRPLMLGGMLWE